VPLQSPITGPLLDFYLYENRLSSFDYINGMNLIDLQEAFESPIVLDNIVGFKFKTTLG
jgi:hypothetical protein